MWCSCAASWFNADRGIVLGVYRQPGANTIEVVDRVHVALAGLRPLLPPALDLRVVADRTKVLRAGIFDLWAVNLFVALLPTLDPKNESVINCAVGRFSLSEGKLKQDQLVIDTSRMRVTGFTR